MRKDLDSWLDVPGRAFEKSGCVREVLRPDCLGSAVVNWNGERSVINERYRRYLSVLGVGVFPSRPGRPQDKGKGEKRIRDIFGRLDLRHRVFRDLKALDSESDRVIETREERWRCGATGLSVRESYRYERRFLRPLPAVMPFTSVRQTVSGEP